MDKECGPSISRPTTSTGNSSLAAAPRSAAQSAHAQVSTTTITIIMVSFLAGTSASLVASHLATRMLPLARSPLHRVGRHSARYTSCASFFRFFFVVPSQEFLFCLSFQSFRSNEHGRTWVSGGFLGGKSCDRPKRTCPYGRGTAELLTEASFRTHRLLRGECSKGEIAGLGNQD